MTIKKVSPDDIETFSIVTNPYREYVSSSAGSTGSVYLFARRSPHEKEVKPLPAFMERTASDANIETLLTDIVRRGSNTSVTDISPEMGKYLETVNTQQQSVRKQKNLEILRFTPSYTFTSNTARKLLVKDTLMPFYRAGCPSYNYGITNYHSLNFFTASSVSPQTVLLYPNTPDANNGYISGSYVPTGSFTLGFHINPRYTTDSPDSSWRAGTIMHMSSTFAVSLVTGSSKDVNGYPNAFRILLQLSHSADVSPSLAIPGTFPNDLTFLSDDNVIKRNHWHDVAIRWGTSVRENGTGSFYIDGEERGTFIVDLNSIAPKPFAAGGKGDPDVLAIGNFYEGTNSGVDLVAQFFAVDPSTRDGLEILWEDTGTEGPTTYAFDHPLNAELHDVYIRDEFSTNDDLASGSGLGPKDLSDYLFYLPPFFTHESPHRQFVGDHGGVLQTPFFAINSTTEDPFNLALSFGVAGHYTNLENFTRDFVTGYYPRALLLTASEINDTTTALSCNTFLYNNEAVRKRNLTILPCDDGTFYPNYDMLTDLSTASLRFHDDLGAFDKSFISLDHLVPSSSLVLTVAADSGSMFEKVTGPSPENMGLERGQVLSIYQRTRDPSSNEVVFFDISNMFYGNRILPGSFSITDKNISGSDGKVSLTLKDDGRGNLFRGDCYTSQSQWNSVGNIFYNEGIVLIKTPMVPFFGQDQFEVSFKGEQNIHTMRINVIAAANQLNSSSNPAYKLLSASIDSSLEDQEFVYLTGLNFHDDNLNVVAKTQLAQPIVKRVGEKYLIRVKVDF